MLLLRSYIGRILSSSLLSLFPILILISFSFPLRSLLLLSLCVSAHYPSISFPFVSFLSLPILSTSSPCPALVMDKEDMLITFEDHVRALEQEEDDNKARDREHEKRNYRKNRDSFQVRNKLMLTTVSITTVL